MSALTNAELATGFRKLGWRVRTTGELRQVIRNFQRAWRLGPQLKVDGIAGPKTAAALQKSLTRLAAGKPTASEHFSFSEFACKCGGRFSDCQRIWILGELIEDLEVLRKEPAYRKGLEVESGCRCEQWNRIQKGASNSQHKYGAACDPKAKVKAARVRVLKRFAGLGRNRSTDFIAHVDRRDISGHNTTRATRTRPTMWNYGR